MYQHSYIDGTKISLPLGKIVCAGRNYAEHAKELNNPIATTPVLFIKPSSAAVSFQDGFSIPENKGRVEHEVEIALLIGETLKEGATTQEIQTAIIGIAPALDLTLRDLQTELKNKGLPWEKAKAFDGACVLSPFISATHCDDLNNINIALSINGQMRQQGNSREMITPVIPLIQHIITHFSLYPGDVILTGTPKGVGTLNKGDQLIMEVPPLSQFKTFIS